VDVDEAKSHQSVDWLAYFKSIQRECPWSLAAYQKGEIDIVDWAKISKILPLEQFQARMYVVDLPDVIVEGMAVELDTRDPESEWLFSYPGYGEFATPVKVLIQQPRARLNQLRAQLEHKQITT